MHFIFNIKIEAKRGLSNSYMKLHGDNQMTMLEVAMTNDIRYPPTNHWHSGKHFILSVISTNPG